MLITDIDSDDEISGGLVIEDEEETKSEQVEAESERIKAELERVKAESERRIEQFKAEATKLRRRLDGSSQQ